MIRPATVLAALAMFAMRASPSTAAPQGGKVVRVERHTTRGLGTPRFCQFSAGTLTLGQCFGVPVEVGETVTIVSQSGVLGLLRVTRVTPDQSCGTVAMWVLVEGEIGGFAQPVPQNEVIGGVVDGAMDPRRARAVPLEASPSGRQTDSDFSAFDTDGDGVADLMFNHFMCDAQGQPSQSMTSQCFETWTVTNHGHDQRRLRLDVVPQC